jgi:phosphatidylserine decarboxylase
MDRNDWLSRLTQAERLNFLVTNRIPRRYATLFMRWFSRIENPLVRAASLAVWQRLGGDLRLYEAERTRFRSLHDCFTRRLRPGARPIAEDPSIVVSPCDAVVGASGSISGTEVFQAKGFPYTLEDLLCDDALVERVRDGTFATLRLRSNMYHRFHAPCDARVRRVTYISGDTWNVNPIALRRIEKLYCKNERAVVELDTGDPDLALLLVPVAAILVASIRLNFLSEPLRLTYRGPSRFECDVAFRKGDEMGYFEHGSTIIVLASAGPRLSSQLREGQRIEMGQPLLRKP